MLNKDKSLEPPYGLLEDSSFTTYYPKNVEVKKIDFTDRRTLGLYLLDLIEKIEIVDPEKELGLWAWLSLFYLDVICPKDASGIRKPGERSRLFPEFDDYQKFFRHLLLGPFLICRLYRDDLDAAWSVLANPPSKPSEVVAQLHANTLFITNKEIVKLASRLYNDPQTGCYKKSYSSKIKGGPRRLISVLHQLNRTHYLQSLNCSEFVELLPKEFDRFIKD
ncbi:MAG: hypothetical protein ACN6I3_00425 [bacterium]